jgi:hypothetical protein
MSITSDITAFVDGCLNGANIASYPTLAKLRDVLLALRGEYGRVTLVRNTHQPIPHDANTAVIWTSRVPAVGDLTHNADQIGCGKTGVVLVTCGLFLDNSGSGVRSAFLSPDNGATTYTLALPNTSNSNVVGSALVPVTAGQTLRSYLYQNSGGALDLLAGSRLEAMYIEPPAG